MNKTPKQTKTWFTRLSKGTGRWLLMRRMPSELGGGEECVKTYAGNWAQLYARKEARRRNGV